MGLAPSRLARKFVGRDHTPHVRRFISAFMCALIALAMGVGMTAATAVPAGASGTSVSDTALTATSSEAGATGVSIRVSFVATHALTAGTDSVTLDASTGYVFPADSACGQYNVTDLTSGADDGCSPLQSGAGTNEVTVAVPNVAAGDQVRVAVDGVTNPSAKGRGSIAVSTSEDTAPVSMATTIVKAASVGNFGVHHDIGRGGGHRSGLQAQLRLHLGSLRARQWNNSVDDHGGSSCQRGFSGRLSLLSVQRHGRGHGIRRRVRTPPER